MFFAANRVRGEKHPKNHRLAIDLRNNAGADRATAFADSETNVLFHRDRANELDVHLDVVARHAHLNFFRKVDRTGNVRRAEVELRTITAHERGRTTAFFLRQDVNVGFEFHVRGDGARLGQALTALDFFAFDTAEKETDVVAGLTLVKRLFEHLNARANRLAAFIGQTDDLNFVADLDDAAFDTTGGDRAATFDRENVFDSHEERFVNVAFRFRNIGVDSVHELGDALRGFRIGRILLSRKGRAADNRAIVAVEVVLRKEFANFELDEFEEFFVRNEVALVHEDDEFRNVNLASQENVLGGLRHRAVDRGDDEDRAVHLRRAGDHVFDEVRVARAVDVSVVAIFRFVFDVRDGDRNRFGRVANGAALRDIGVGFNLSETFRRLNRQNSARQRGFTMVDVTDRADVNVRLSSLESFLRHANSPYN